MANDKNNEKELVDHWENKWIKLEFNLATNLITAGKASRMYYLTFFISLNLAIYAGMKYLMFGGYTPSKSMEGVNIPITFSLALALIIINLTLYLLYIRAHSAEKDHFNQIWRIRQYFKEKLGLKELLGAKWFLYNENFSDPLKGWGYKIIMFVISLLTAASIALLIGAILFLSKTDYVIIWAVSLLIMIVFLIILFILALVIPNISRGKNCCG